MKGLKLFFGILGVLMFAASAQAQTLEGKKMGYLDLSRVFDEYAKTKEYDAALEAKHKDFEKERNAKIDKLKEAQGKLPALKDDEKSKLQGEIDGMINDLKEFDRQKGTDFTKERDERIREILLEIEKIVSDYAKKENYAFVLNDRVLVYGNETYDITAPIIKLLNENYPPKGKK